jgi:hypothetical protein
MPLQKILFKPGVNRENTRYTTEGGWYECDKVRFRQGNPEVIGGWEPLSTATFVGTCRSLWNWVTLGNLNLVSIGTNLKFYIERGGAYFDITPLRVTTTLPTDPFTGNGTTTVTVNAPANGALTGDFVTFSGVTGTYASLLNGEFQISSASTNAYNITVASAIPAGTTGGSAVSAAYQINTGPEFAVPFSGWGAGPWSYGSWGTGGSTLTSLRVWSQGNWGEDLIFGPRNGGIYYWDATAGVGTRGFDLATAVGASDVPTVQNYLFVSDINRFLFAFGCNDYGSAIQDPMLIRWSDQEDAYNWTPAATNQAGSLRLSRLRDRYGDPGSSGNRGVHGLGAVLIAVSRRSDLLGRSASWRQHLHRGAERCGDCLRHRLLDGRGQVLRLRRSCANASLRPAPLCVQ